MLKNLVLIFIALVLSSKTLSAQDFKASAYPDRIILTWSEDPKTTQSVTWRTDSTVTIAYAQVVKEESSPKIEKPLAKEYTAITTQLKGANYETSNYHSAIFWGYRYRKIGNFSNRTSQ